MSKPHRTGKKREHPAEIRALAPVFEKSATELKLKQKVLKCKNTIYIKTLNVRTSNRIGQLPELTASAIDPNIEIICVPEHIYLYSEDIKYHDTGNRCTFVSASAWIRNVRMLISPRARKSLNSIEKIQPRMMVATFNGNPSITIICYSPPMLVKKRTSSPFITSYPLLFVASQNTTFS